jgi:hypothetical protein
MMIVQVAMLLSQRRWTGDATARKKNPGDARIGKAT